MGVYTDLEKLNKPSSPPATFVGSSHDPKPAESAEAGGDHVKKVLPPHHLEPTTKPATAEMPARIRPNHPPERPTGRTVVRTDGRMTDRTPGRSARRTILRHSFEVYNDQIELLRRVSLEAKLAGDELSMSEMVREALDAYLTRKHPEPNARPGERSSARTDE